MKFSTAFVNSFSVLSLAWTVTGKNSSLRGHNPDLSGPFDVLKCSFEGKADEGMCSSAVTKDDKPCSFCSVKKGGQESGLCVDPQLAAGVKQKSSDISCTNTDSLSVDFDQNSFKCTLEAVNDADKCSSTKTADQQGCEFCTVNGPFGEKGICVSPEHADKLQGIGGDNISCISHNGVYFSEPLSNSPMTDCNISGTDNVTCLDPSKVNGSKCVWCDAEIGGFCFPKSWQETAGRFLTCVDSQPSLVEEAELEVNEDLDIDASIMMSSCVTVGLKGGSPADCRNTVDDASGNHCIVCSAPKFGGFGTCMPPKYKGAEGSFYVCDKNSASILAEE